jgi:hypothetical protein
VRKVTISFSIAGLLEAYALAGCDFSHFIWTAIQLAFRLGVYVAAPSVAHLQLQMVLEPQPTSMGGRGSLFRKAVEAMALSLRPSNSEPDDYSVIHRDGSEWPVGRIFKSYAGQPKETPWFWAVEFHQRKGRTPPYQGVTADRETAMAAFKRCWESADIPVRKPPRKSW